MTLKINISNRLYHILPFARIALPLLVVFSSFKTNGQYIANFNRNDEIFRYEVKVIDEFIERFDDDPKSFIRETYKQEHKTFSLTRAELVTSLFNLSNKEIVSDSSINGFIRKVTDKKHPILLSFTDSNWYAEAEAVVNYDNRQMEVPLVLHIQKTSNDGFKWMIAGVGDIVPTTAGHSNINYKDFKVKTQPKYISTSAYATNFVELHHVIADNIDPADFFDPAFISSEKGSNFIRLIKEDKVHFLYVRSLKFYFYEVSGWVFSVEQFKRQTNNSGWLINNIKKVNEAQKTEMKNKLLHI